MNEGQTQIFPHASAESVSFFTVATAHVIEQQFRDGLNRASGGKTGLGESLLYNQRVYYYDNNIMFYKLKSFISHLIKSRKESLVVYGFGSALEPVGSSDFPGLMAETKTMPKMAAEKVVVM